MLNLNIIRKTGLALALRTITPINTGFNGSRGMKRWVKPTLREFRRRAEKEKFQNHGLVRLDDCIKRRSNYAEWNRSAELYAFSARLSENIEEGWLDSAFTDRSHIIAEETKQKALGIENPEILIPDNRDLIAEGDKYICDYVTEYLRCILPKLPEAGILATRDYLLSQNMLANISKDLGTTDLILIKEYPPPEYALANVFKAVVAALLHSSGEERASIFVRDFVITQLNGVDISELWQIDDPISMLKELVTKNGMPEPEPRLLGNVGKNTLLACSRVGYYIDKKLFCSGYGETENIALEMAAREGLRKLFGIEETAPPLDYKLSLVMKLSDSQKHIASSTST